MEPAEMDNQTAMSQQELSAEQARPEAAPSNSNRVVTGDQSHHWSGRWIALGAALWVGGVILLVALSFAAQQHAEFPDDVGLATSS